MATFPCITSSERRKEPSSERSTSELTFSSPRTRWSEVRYRVVHLTGHIEIWLSTYWYSIPDTNIQYPDFSKCPVGWGDEAYLPYQVGSYVAQCIEEKLGSRWIIMNRYLSHLGHNDQKEVLSDHITCEEIVHTTKIHRLQAKSSLAAKTCPATGCEEEE